MKRLGILGRSDRGTAVVELGLALPVLLVLALAATDFVSAFSYKLKLQQYAQAGANFVVAHGENDPAPGDVKTEVASLSGLDASKIKITRWTECNQSEQDEYDTCPGSSDVKVSYMQIEVEDTYDPMISIDRYSEFLGATDLVGSVVVRLP